MRTYDTSNSFQNSHFSTFVSLTSPKIIQRETNIAKTKKISYGPNYGGEKFSNALPGETYVNADRP